MSNSMDKYTKATPTLSPSFTPIQSGLLQRKCVCGQHTFAGGECEECRQKREGMTQRAATSPATVSTVPPIVHDVLGSSGQPLDTSTRAFMESRFGHDFSQVRVHTDAKAAESAQAVNAFAFTLGKDVVFGEGQYAPGTSEGRRLLSHELTHTIQQSPSTLRQPTSLSIAEQGGLAEQEADLASRGILQESIPIVTPVSTAQIARQQKSTEAEDIQWRRRSSRYHLLSERLELRMSLPLVNLKLPWDPTKAPPQNVTIIPSPTPTPEPKKEKPEPTPEPKKEKEEEPKPVLQLGRGRQQSLLFPGQPFNYVQITGSYNNWFPLPHSHVKNLPSWLLDYWIKDFKFIGEPGFTFQFHTSGTAEAAKGSVDAQATMKLMQMSFRTAQGDEKSLSLLAGGTWSNIGQGSKDIPSRLAPLTGIESEYGFTRGPVKVTLAFDALATYQNLPGQQRRAVDIQLVGELRISVDLK